MHSNCMVLLSQAFRCKEQEETVYVSLLHENTYQHLGTQSDDAWIALSCMWKSSFFHWYTLCITSVPIMYQGLLKHFMLHLWILTNSTISTLSKASPNIWQHQREIGCVCSDGAWTWGMMYRKKEWKERRPWYQKTNI